MARSKVRWEDLLIIYAALAVFGMIGQGFEIYIIYKHQGSAVNSDVLINILFMIVIMILQLIFGLAIFVAFGAFIGAVVMSVATMFRKKKLKPPRADHSTPIQNSKIYERLPYDVIPFVRTMKAVSRFISSSPKSVIWCLPLIRYGTKSL